MANKTYLITGSNRGLGLEFVRQISQDQNNQILALVRSLQGELDDLKSLASSNSKIHILECDTGNVSSIQQCGTQITKVLGDGQLHYLINNAGINSVPQKTALTMTPEDIRSHIEINVIGPNELVKACDKHLKQGSVVMNMTSGLGSIGLGIVKCSAYAMSKCALNMVTAHLAGEMKERGVRVFVMDPGWVKTRMGGEGAVLEAHESIGGMLKVLRKEGIDDTGLFYEYSGETKPW